MSRITVTALTLVAVASGCGARTGLPVPDPPRRQDAALVRHQNVGALDLLFVVDTSLSMADKQRELARRVPQLVKSLVSPDPDPVTGAERTPPVPDLHVAVITSSLGGHGTSHCRGREHADDRAHLMPREGAFASQGWFVQKDGEAPRPATCGAPVPSSVLTWVYDPRSDERARFVGAKDAAALQIETSCVLSTLGEEGCGYEETLESLRRFLVDPAPYVSATVSCRRTSAGDDCGDNDFVVSGVDTELLAQRRAFLRPDSLLAVIILTDENDGSTQTTGKNWVPLAKPAGTMPRAFSSCANVPDDLEPATEDEHQRLFRDFGCRSCATPNDADPSCRLPRETTLENDFDVTNLRMFHQVQRFGRNYLWPVQRYVSAFRDPMVVGSDGKLAKNPIFESPLRTRDLVLVAGIVGVPKELVSNPDGTPRFLGPAEWERLVSPDPTKRDPHMLESIGPRTGIAIYKGDPTVDPISGGDRESTNRDLQYACIAPRLTDEPTYMCTGVDEWKTDPVCERGGTQPRFRALPGVRHLRMLRDLGASGLAASVCDETLSAAVDGITARLQQIVASSCNVSLSFPDSSSALDCVLLEVLADAPGRCEDLGGGRCTPGSARCRTAASSHPPERAARAALRLRVPSGASAETVDTFTADGNVYATTSDGVRHLVCETMQLAAPFVDETTARACRNDPSEQQAAAGWCWTTDPTLVTDQCIRAGSRGRLRFLGPASPRTGSHVSMACGAAR